MRVPIFLSIVICALVVWASPATCQTDTVGGIINRYTRLTYIECTNNSAIIVENPYGFKVGDRILIIQMKGADITRSSDSTFGNVTAYNNAGNYELATIDEIHGKSFVLKYELARTYTLSGIVQVIRVPSYTNVMINDTLKAQPWNGSTGGVVAFIASGSVTLNSDIDVSGAGFRGMVDRWPGVNLQVLQPDFGSAPSGSLHYYSDSLQWDSGGVKGEGIHEALRFYMGARGQLANAGGGGHMYQSGGGGGGNAGKGGTGGKDREEIANGGIGGMALPYTNSDNRIFLGGSGGSAGPTDEFQWVGGESGGGIVLIKANEIAGNDHVIRANGVNDSVIIGVVNGGGGGAGGVVLLEVNTYSDTLSVEAKGGNGGDINIGCIGPGGGGGGGCVWVKGGSLPSTNVTIIVDGGTAGTATGGTCSPNQHHGAEAGAVGVKLTGLQIPVGTTPR